MRKYLQDQHSLAAHATKGLKKSIDTREWNHFGEADSHRLGIPVEVATAMF